PRARTRAPPPPPAAAAPCATAPPRPAPPAGGGVASTTRSLHASSCWRPRDSAVAAVPSELPSSTSTADSVPGYSCASRDGSVCGRMAASSRAGITATTDGQPSAPGTCPGAGLPGWPGAGRPAAGPGGPGAGRQRPPLQQSRYTQASAASTQAATKIGTPAASHSQLRSSSPATPLSSDGLLEGSEVRVTAAGLKISGNRVKPDVVPKASF